MADRNVKVMGYTDDSGVSMTMRFNDVDVFDGNITQGGTSDSPVELFNFDIDQTVSGNIPSITTISGGSATVVGLTSNHSKVVTSGDGGDNPAVTEDDVINDYEYFDDASNNSKLNMNVSGEDLVKLGEEDLSGNWHVLLGDGDSLLCDYAIQATPLPPEPPEPLTE